MVRVRGGNILALKKEDESTSQGMHVASGIWKRQGNRPSLEPPEE